MSHNIKKALFLLHLPPPVHGSSLIGKHISESNEIALGFVVKHINLNTSGNLAEIGTFNLKKIAIYFSIIKKTLNALAFFKPNLVYFAITVNGVAFYKDAIIVLLCRIFGKKIIFHFHNNGVKANSSSALYRFIYGLVFKGNYAIVLTPLLHSDIVDYFKKDNVFICPNGTEDVAGRAIINYRFQRMNQHRDFVFLFLGNLIKSKGCLDVIKASFLLKQKGINHRLFIVGKEADVTRKQIEHEVAKYDLKEYVTYLGPKYGQEKSDVFLQVDTLVFPTIYHYETFGLVNIEAMQWGIPVVTSKAGGISDVVKDGFNGFITEPVSPEEIASKLEILAGNQMLCYEMGMNGRSEFELKYTIRAFENRISEILKKCYEIEFGK